MKPLKESCSPCAAIMFCGLPISVPDEPVLAAKQKARRKGIGFSPRASVIDTRSGVIATTTTSLVRMADSRPDTTTSMASSTGGDTSRVVTQAATLA